MKKPKSYFINRGINCLKCGYYKFKTQLGAYVCRQCGTMRI